MKTKWCSIRSVDVLQPLSRQIETSVIGLVLTSPRKPPSWLLNVSETIRGCSRILSIARTYPKRTDLGNIPRYNAPENRTRLYGEQGGNCNGCGTHFESQHLEIDHIIARNPLAELTILAICNCSVLTAIESRVIEGRNISSQDSTQVRKINSIEG